MRTGTDRRADTLVGAGAYDPIPITEAPPHTAPCRACGERACFRGADAPRFQAADYLCGSCQEGMSEE